jgi:Tfp pilus assembly protein PilO
MLREYLTKSAHSTRTVMLAAFMMIGVVAFYNWTVAPHRNYLIAAQRYESAVDLLDKKNQRIRYDLKVKRNKLDELQEKLRQIQLGLFDPVEAGQFLNNIQTESEQAGCVVSLLTFATGSAVSEKNHSNLYNSINKQQAVLNVSGGYTNIIALMKKLQDTPKKVCIDSVEINSNDQSIASLECEMTITIYVIHRKEERQHD